MLVVRVARVLHSWLSMCPSLWSVGTRDRAEKVITESEEVLAEVHSFGHTLYSSKTRNLPYFAGMVTKHIPIGTADNWAEVLLFT